jgi:DNA-binding transcriptional LysR family regulator
MRGSEYAELRSFVAIVEEGSFARAAARIGVSPSALSQSLRALEGRLGVRLINRTTRSLAPTEAGDRLFTRVRPAIVDLEGAAEAVNAFRDRPAGIVRVNAPRLAVTRIVEPLLAAFCEAYPDIVVDLVVDDALTDITAAGFDIGIRLGELLENDMIAVRLTEPIRQIAVASPAYIARFGTPQAPSDLLDHRCINWRRPGLGSIYHWEFRRPEGDWFSVAVDGPLIVNDRSVARRAALDGLGIAFWVEEEFVADIAAGLLVPLLEQYCGTFPGFHLYYSDRWQMPAAVRAFVDHLKRGIV